MTKRASRLFFIYILSLSLIYSPVVRSEQLSLPSSDLVAPKVIHEPIEQTISAGSERKFTAIVTDNVSVQSVTLFYRTIGDKSYKRKAMISSGADTYSATLDSEAMIAPGIEYYIQATDTSGNNLLHGYSFSPLTVNVSPTAIKSPEELSFAPEEDTSSNKWLWIGLGVLAVAAAAGGGGGGGGDEGSVTINAPLP